ncbi:MAG TPA: PLP-dependent transferase, partial [Arenimonas sp.]|nr:PLP-dependent transferase [Arenimonas sp.]
MSRIETLAVHAGGEPDEHTGAVSPPIHMATTFRHGPAGERQAGYEYQRESNPTQDRLEAALAAMEGGQTGLCFGSGMAAMAAVLESLPTGSHLL